MIYTRETIQVADKTLLEGNFFEEINTWKTHNQNHLVQRFQSNSLSDEEYNRAKEALDTMRDQEKNYTEYKKAFDRFCNLIHIVPRGVIFKRCNLTRGKDGKHSLVVDYSYNTKKITLPEDTVLYHMSKVGGIKELIPQFRGKSEKGFLYDKARVYFTIRKNMPKFLADYKMTEKLHMYVCREKIKEVYVDPLVWTNIQGAVYVETTRPIKVEEITKKTMMDRLGLTKEVDGVPQAVSVDESIDFEHFLNFVTESGFEIIE